MESQIYYIVKEKQERFFFPGRYDSSKEALEALNKDFFDAREIGEADSSIQYGIYRVEVKRDYDSDGILLSECMEIRIWMWAEYSEINDKYIMYC